MRQHSARADDIFYTSRIVPVGLHQFVPESRREGNFICLKFRQMPDSWAADERAYFAAFAGPPNTASLVFA